MSSAGRYSILFICCSFRSGSKPLSLHHLEVLVVDAAEGHGEAAEAEDELSVAVDADDVALIAAEGAGEDAEEDVVPGELLEGGVEEGQLLGMCPHDVHEGLHHAVGDGGRASLARVVDEMVVGEVLGEEALEVSHPALQEDEAADGGLQRLLHAALALLVLVGVAERLVDEEGLPLVAVVGIVGLEPTLEGACRHVAQEEVAPGGSLFGDVGIEEEAVTDGHIFHSRIRRFCSSDDADALW